MPLVKYALIFENSCLKEAQYFISNFESLIKHFKYPIKSPLIINIGNSKYLEDYSHFKTLFTNENPLEKLELIIFIHRDSYRVKYQLLDLQLKLMREFKVYMLKIKTNQLNEQKENAIMKCFYQIQGILGGEPWKLEKSVFQDEPTLVIGISVYQDPYSKHKITYFVSFSKDQRFSKYS